MDNRVVPSVSDDKFIHEPLLKLDTLYAYFLSSEFSQTNFYKGNISSMKYIFERNSDDMNKILTETDRALDLYLGRYFDKVETDIKYIEEDNLLAIAIIVTDKDGNESSLNNTLAIANGKLDTYSAVSDILLNT